MRRKAATIKNRLNKLRRENQDWENRDYTQKYYFKKHHYLKNIFRELKRYYNHETRTNAVKNSHARNKELLKIKSMRSGNENVEKLNFPESRLKIEMGKRRNK